MATLNQSETQSLRDLLGFIDGVLRDGYDPSKADSEPAGKDAHLRIGLAVGKKRLHTVIQMKGHYPK